MKLSKPMMDDQPHDLDSLAALVEGRLDGADRQRVMAHVVECVDCRRTLAQLGRAVADGVLTQNANPLVKAGWRWSNTRIWLPIAASLLVGTFAWFQLATSPDVSTNDAAPTGVFDEELLRKRSAGRTVAGKTFRLNSGIWVDAAFDPTTEVQTVVVSGLEDRSALLARIPELTPFTELGDRVVVVWEGTVYRFEP